MLRQSSDVPDEGRPQLKYYKTDVVVEWSQ